MEIEIREAGFFQCKDLPVSGISGDPKKHQLELLRREDVVVVRVASVARPVAQK